MYEYVNSISQEEISKFIQMEKDERRNNNFLKCLEVCTKILMFYISKQEFQEVIDKMKSLCKKRNQSGFVIIGIIKFSIKMLLPSIENNDIILIKYYETLKIIFDSLKVDKDNSTFELLKKNLINAIDNKQYEEVQHLILNYEYGLNDIKYDNKAKSKKITIGDAEFTNTESSTKIDNKIELTLNNKESVTSTRNLNLYSPASSSGKSVKNDFCPNIKLINSDNIQFNRKTNLPLCRLAVDITLSAIQIKQIFLHEMNNMNLRITGNEKSENIYAEKRDLNILKNILRCLRIMKSPIISHIIQLSIRYSENKFERIIEVKGNAGLKDICENLIIIFLKNLAKKVKKMRILKTSDINIDFILKEHILQEKMNQMKLYGSNTPLNYENLNEEDISVVDNSNREASNYYEFYRILSQENYDLGKNVSDFIQEFKNINKDINSAVNRIPLQMRELHRFSEECISTFYCYFNFGKSNTEKMLPYCRPAVEKFIFNKVYNILYDTYDLKYRDDNQKFMINQNIIKLKKSPTLILKALEVKKQFIEEDDNEIRKIIPFKTTIDCINKVEFEVSPKEKFDTLMKASLELRNCILDITKGRYELTSMDEELPLFIYLTTQINVRNILAELYLIEDYLMNCKSIDKESKVLTNLFASVNFISQTQNLEEHFSIKEN